MYKDYNIILKKIIRTIINHLSNGKLPCYPSDLLKDSGLKPSNEEDWLCGIEIIKILKEKNYIRDAVSHNNVKQIEVIPDVITYNKSLASLNSILDMDLK